MSVHIIMGSMSDQHIGKKVTAVLQKFKVSYQVSVISAHRSLHLLEATIDQSEAQVFIGIAGKAAHLSGVIAGLTHRPVIGVPVKSSTLGGLEALLATVEMPTGVPVATVAIDGGANAGILATQMLSVGDATLANRLLEYKQELVTEVIQMGKDLGEI